MADRSTGVFPGEWEDARREQRGAH